MKFLVMGATGMAGHTICLYLKEQGHEVVGFDLKKSPIVTSIAANAADSEKVKEIVENGSYDYIINAIGLLNKAAEDNKASAVYLNSYLPHFLSDITKEMKTNIIHMSTDCVFSGKDGRYTENSLRDGETFYDRTKALGEIDDDKNITFRNSIVGADMNENGIGLFNWFMKQSGTIKGYSKAMWTGLTTLQLAKAMERAAEEKVSGLYNMVYKENISKYDLLGLFNKYFRDNKINIEPCEDVTADKTLVRTNFEFDYIIPDYEKMVFEMSEWVKKHKELYPHYNLG